MRKSLHSFYIIRLALGTDRFLSRAFVHVATSDAPVLVPFQFFHVKCHGTTNGTHAASPHIIPYRYNQKNIVLQTPDATCLIITRNDPGLAVFEKMDLQTMSYSRKTMPVIF